MYFIFLSHCGMLMMFRGGLPGSGMIIVRPEARFHPLVPVHGQTRFIYLFSNCRWEGRVIRPSHRHFMGHVTFSSPVA